MRNVATLSPPMMTTAMGPQKMLRVSGIIARMAVAAVRITGRARRTADSITASQAVIPPAMSCSIWSIRMTEFRMSIPASAITPSNALNPNGAWKRSRNATAPMRPSGEMTNTRNSFLKSCTWAIRSVSMTRIMAGKTAYRALFAFSLSSTAPPVSIR